MRPAVQRSALFVVALFTATVILGLYQNCASSSGGNGITATASTAATSNQTSAYSSPGLISSVSSLTINPGDTATITVTLSGAPTTTLNFQYKTVDGSAVSGTNYTSSSGVLAFGVGQTINTITVSSISKALTNSLYFMVYFGQLDTAPAAFVAATVTLQGSNVATTNGIATQILTTGDFHTCVIRTGQLYCFGENNDGQLGIGTNTDMAAPQPVSTLPATVTSVSAGMYHTCAIANQQVYCWGLNTSGQLGIGNTTNYNAPVQVQGLTGATQIASGDNFSCALINGAVACWGYGQNGQLGNGAYVNQAAPVSVLGLTGVTYISAGSTHACAIANSMLYCWGGNSAGQIGDGTTTNHPTPYNVGSLGSAVTSVSAGLAHTCAVTNSRPYCWGANLAAELGNGTQTTSLSPVGILNLSSALVVAVNLDTSCGVNTSGGLECWGDNGTPITGSGQVGTGSTTSWIGAANLVFSGGVSAVSQGHGFHACAIYNSQYYCWGYNKYGEVGVGSTNSISYNIPQLLSF